MSRGQADSERNSGYAFCQALADYQFVPGSLVSLIALAIVAGLSLLVGFLTQSAALRLALLSGAMAVAV